MFDFDFNPLEVGNFSTIGCWENDQELKEKYGTTSRYATFSYNDNDDDYYNDDLDYFDDNFWLND